MLWQIRAFPSLSLTTSLCLEPDFGFLFFLTLLAGTLKSLPTFAPCGPQHVSLCPVLTRHVPRAMRRGLRRLSSLVFYTPWNGRYKWDVFPYLLKISFGTLPDPSLVHIRLSDLPFPCGRDGRIQAANTYAHFFFFRTRHDSKSFPCAWCPVFCPILHHFLRAFLLYKALPRIRPHLHSASHPPRPQTMTLEQTRVHPALG